jgi:H+/Cl- antiporter ClcA
MIVGFVAGAAGALVVQWLVARRFERRRRRRWMAHGPLDLP